MLRFVQTVESVVHLLKHQWNQADFTGVHTITPALCVVDFGGACIRQMERKHFACGSNPSNHQRVIVDGFTTWMERRLRLPESLSLDQQRSLRWMCYLFTPDTGTTHFKKTSCPTQRHLVFHLPHSSGLASARFPPRMHGHSPCTGLGGNCVVCGSGLLTGNQSGP